MLTIYTKDKFLPEKTYIFDVLLSEFLGFDFEIKFHSEESYKIIIENGNYIEFSDNFFSRNNEEHGYLLKKNLPEAPFFLFNNKFTSEIDLPVIYGNDFFEINEKRIKSGQDIFASAFFMLSRWEEKVKDERDIYDRFPDKNAFVQIYGLQYRPLVNEYTIFLLNLLREIEYTKKEKKHIYKPVITHDVDEIARYDKFSKFIRALGGDILNRKSIKALWKTKTDFLKIKFLKRKDNYDTFDLLMDTSEENNLKSNFYFIPAFKNEEDARYDIRDKRVKLLIDKIIERGHIVGIHGAFRSYKSPDLFKEELQRLKKINNNISDGRQHYLRFSNPETWQMWEGNSLKRDSSMSFSYGGGFRSGTCFEYPVFNIETRQKLKLLEMPLIAMEVAIYSKYPDKEKYYENIIYLSNIVRKYKGNFVFLWHNSNFNTFEWNFGLKYYKNIISEIK